MRRCAIAVAALIALLPLPSMAASVTVKPGETLSEIAERYSISLRSLLQVNGISNSDHVEAGRKIRLPNGSRGVASAGSGRHRVREGDTLGSIAARYRVRERDLIAINGLRHADHIELGQTIRLPQGAALPQRKPAAIKANPNAKSHRVAQGQTLSQIAMAYRIPVATLVDINGLSNPNRVDAGVKLSLRRPSPKPSKPKAQPAAAKPVTTTKPAKSVTTAKPAVSEGITPRVNESAATLAKTTAAPTTIRDVVQVAVATTKPVATAKPVATTKPEATAKPNSKKSVNVATKTVTKTKAKAADWRSYGPLQVDWANWQSMAGSYVVPTLNSSGQPLYVAVNCAARQLNATDVNGTWKTWDTPKDGFEKDLLKDRCKMKLS